MNPCETCTGLSDTEWFNLPECQILAERPCVDGRWTDMGPLEITGSENRSFNRGIGCAKNVVVDESDHRRVYATGEHGGVWVLSRADLWPQSRWAPIGDALEGLQMRAIAIAPSEPERLYVGNAFGFIYVSRNRGSSWTRTGDTDLGFIRRILVDRTRQQTLFVATNSGLHRSADSGGTWTQLLDPGLFSIPDVLDAVMDPDDSTVLYMGVRRQGVFKSSDSGQSWTLVLPFSDALSQANEMIRLSLGLRHAGGTSQSDLDRTVAVKFGREVLINNDGGRSSFVSKGERGGSGGSRRRSDGGQFRGEWCNVLAVDPNNPSLVLAGQEDLLETTDAGATWRSVMPDQPGIAGRLTHEDFQDVCFDAQKPGVAYLACDGGVYLYVDARVDDPDGDLDAEQFEERNNGLAVSEFFRVSVHGSLAIGNLDHNGLKATTDVASKTWQHVPVGNNALETHSVYADPKRTGRFYTVNLDSAGGSLKRLRFPTVDAPTDLLVFAPFVPYFSDVSSLTQVSQFASLPMSPIAVDVRAGSNVMLACAHRSSTEGFRLMLTYEAHREPTVDAAGNSTFLPAWEVAYDNGRQDPIVSVTFAPSAPGTAYAISAAGRVVSKADVTAGAADDGWDVRGPWPQTDVRQIAVNAQFPERIYAVSGQAFGRSSDGGRQWAIADVTSPQGHELNSLAVHPHDPHTLFVGADTGVFISYDEGARWASYDVGLPNAEVTQVQTDGPYLYAVTHGRGLWRRRYC